MRCASPQALLSQAGFPVDASSDHATVSQGQWDEFCGQFRAVLSLLRQVGAGRWALGWVVRAVHRDVPTTGPTLPSACGASAAPSADGRGWCVYPAAGQLARAPAPASSSPRALRTSACPRLTHPPGHTYTSHTQISGVWNLEDPCVISGFDMDRLGTVQVGRAPCTAAATACTARSLLALFVSLGTHQLPTAMTMSSFPPSALPSQTCSPTPVFHLLFLTPPLLSLTQALASEPAGTFICRFSMSQPGCLVLSCKTQVGHPKADGDDLIHAIINVGALACACRGACRAGKKGCSSCSGHRGLAEGLPVRDAGSGLRARWHPAGQGPTCWQVARCTTSFWNSAYNHLNQP